VGQGCPAPTLTPMREMKKLPGEKTVSGWVLLRMLMDMLDN